MPDAEEVCRELLKRDILVDYRPNAGVRMSPHFYNKDEELETAIAAVDEILKERSVAQSDKMWRTGALARQMQARAPARAARRGTTVTSLLTSRASPHELLHIK